jgi:succinate--hydroxymethylglutarate CoA-transferase
LEKIRVLDLTTVVAGPTASMILADLGADVIKIERIDGGDDARAMGPIHEGWGCFFVSLARGKRSLALDITRPEGREVVLKLAESADVLLENFRGGKLERLGLGYDEVKTRNKQIIYASLSGYGPRGPDRAKPAYDALIQGRTGIVSVTGTPDSPTRAGVSVVDTGAGMWAAMGILTALYERAKSGHGQKVETSLFQTGVMAMYYHLAFAQFTGRDPQPQGTGHSAFAPYGAFEGSDGRFLLGISNDRQFGRLAEALGFPEWSSDPHFADNVSRVENRPILYPLLNEIFRKLPKAHWINSLEGADIPVSALQTASELLADPQLLALRQMHRLDAGVDVPAIPFDLSLTPPKPGSSLPRLGQHSRQILLEAGFSDSQIQDLRAAGVVDWDERPS